MFEWCVLFITKSAFDTSPLQFGFKEGLSTDLCTGLIMNVVARYTTNNSAMYGCFLDASKAFDRVNYALLFEKLLNHNLYSVVTKTIVSWYTLQQVCIRWNTSHSEKFSINNGVRQGVVFHLFSLRSTSMTLFLSLKRLGSDSNTALVQYVTQMILPCLPLPLLPYVTC